MGRVVTRRASGETTPRPGTAPTLQHYNTTTPGDPDRTVMSAPGKEGASRPLGPDGKPIPGPAEVRQIQAARKMAQQQAQVEEVIGIMHTNVENVLERDRKLGDLEERADALQDGCAQFEKQAAAMKNKFWMENLKAIIAGSVVGLIVLGLLYWKFFMPETQYHPAPPAVAEPAGPVAPVGPVNEPSVSDDSSPE